VRKITESEVFEEAFNSKHYFKLIPTPFLSKEKICDYTQAECHGTHSKFFLMTALRKTFG
jgi:hypothetical protein